MSEMPGNIREKFEELHEGGMRAKEAGDHVAAAEIFEMADELAENFNDKQKRLKALNPQARALWTLGDYENALDRLNTASIVARELGLKDESAIVISNIGRLAAVRVVKTVEVQDIPKTLRYESVPFFVQARMALAGHPHYYYRFANAQHGAPIAALAGENDEVNKLIDEAVMVAYERSPLPYDQVPTHVLSLKGLGQLALARGYLEASKEEKPALAQRIIAQIR